MVETSRMLRHRALSRVPAVQVRNALSLELSTRVSPILPVMTLAHTTVVLPGTMLRPTVCFHVNHPVIALRIQIVSPILLATRRKHSCVVQVLMMHLHANVLVRYVILVS